MKSLYCGWDKDLGDDLTSASDFGTLPLPVKEEIVEKANETDVYSNAVASTHKKDEPLPPK